MSNPPASTQSPNAVKRVSKMVSNQSMNLNHLLNFTLPPRAPRPLSSIPRRSRRTGTSHGVWNKERFVNAQYRFMMNPNGDYTVHFADPDIFFQWQDILQVIIPRSPVLASAVATTDQSFTAQEEGQITCPICLSPPAAPRMTKCGHIYCFPCILHYLGMSDNKWARCPICFDSVNERQLKCVKWFDNPVIANEDDGVPKASSSSSSLDYSSEISLRSGSLLRMRLIQRPQITTLALPRSCTWPSDLIPPHQAPFHFLPDVYNFAKFMLATPAYVISDLMKDLDDLASERRILTAMKDELGVSFVDGAETKVRQQIAKASALDTPILQEQIQKALQGQRNIEETARNERRRKEQALSQPVSQIPHEEVPTDFLFAKSQNTGIVLTPESSPGNLILQESLSRPLTVQPRTHPRQRKNLNPPPPSTSTFYYYQAAFGLPIYLHPLDIRILLSHFNSYASFPDTITVRIEAFSEGTVNDELRKKCKYLAHLPEGADVIFIEADLEGVVGAESLKNFEAALKMRTTKRKDKIRKDDKAKARAEEREREREKTWTSSYSPSTPMTVPIFDRPAMEDFSSSLSTQEEILSAPSRLEEETPPTQSQSTASGAWGARSFASALHSTPSQSHAQHRPRPNVEDEWDIDAAWHEMEQRTNGRRKRGAKLVLLGGGGGRRR